MPGDAIEAHEPPAVARGMARPPGRRSLLGDAAKVAALFAMSRCLLVGVGMLAWGHQRPDYPWRGADRSGVRFALVQGRPFLDMWTRWDSWQYDQIAREGYWYDRDHKPDPYGTVACFPLYPLAIRGLATALGGRTVIAGLVLSNAAAVAGLVLLFRWAGTRGDRGAAWMVVSAAIFHPAGLFWSALYPQSLFFLLSVACLMLMLDGRVAPASLVGAAVTATRLEGIAILPALLAIRSRQRGARLDVPTAWLLIVPAGLLAYMAYLQSRWGDPVLFLKVHAIFGRAATNPLATLLSPWLRPGGLRDYSLGGLLDFRVLLTYGTGLLLLALGPRSKVGWPVLIYGWALFLIPLSTGVYESIYRVHLVNAPAYLALGLGLTGRWRILGWAWVVGSAVLGAVLMVAWVAGLLLP